MFNERQQQTQRHYEAKGYTLLKNFASTLQLTNIIQHEEGDTIDYTATTSKGNVINIEVKTRTCNSTQYPTTFIRKDKLMSLINAEGYSLYINFFNDGVVGVWIITDDDLKCPSEWRRVWNEGNGYMDDELYVYLPNDRKKRLRYYIPTDDGKYKALDGYSFS